MPVRRPISIILIDDHSSVREGVATLIRALPGFRVLAATADITSALRTVAKKRPGVVLLNWHRIGEDMLAVARALSGEVPSARVIIMGSNPAEENVVGLVRARVSGFIMANASFYEFLSTIHSVAQGVQILPLELTHTLFGQLHQIGRQRPGQRTRGLKGLTRQVEVTTWSLQSSSLELDRISLI